MPSRRDQLQSYQFLLQRVVSALVMRDTDPIQSPFRRFAGATFASVMIAIIALAGVAVYGLLRPGGKKTWRQDTTIIVEKETGAKYIYLDKKLHPVLNQTSAKLLGRNVTVSVSRNSLRDTPRGPTLGIPGAPDSLPTVKDLVRQQWTLCTRVRRDEQQGTQLPRTTLYAGGRPAGGVFPRPNEEGILVKVQESRTSVSIYLIHNDRKYPIRQPTTVLRALTWQDDADNAMLVGNAWLNAVPEAKAIDLPPVEDLGKPSTVLTPHKNGQVFVVETSGGQKQYYVAVPDGHLKITPLQRDLLVGSDRSDKEVPISADDVKESRAPPRPREPTDPPDAVPTLRNLARDSATCVVYKDSEPEPTVYVDAEPPSATGLTTVRQTSEGNPLVDEVVVQPGKGVLVQSSDNPLSLNLVTDLGIAYPVPSIEVVATLGYVGAIPVNLPSNVMARLPQGPTLSPDAALTQIP